jgi:hypothetical protein
MIELTWQLIGLVALAASIATMIRIKDTPPLVLVVDGRISLAAVATLVETYVASATAAVVTAMVLAETNDVTVYTLGGLAAITAAAIGGMSTVRAALNLMK